MCLINRVTLLCSDESEGAQTAVASSVLTMLPSSSLFIPPSLSRPSSINPSMRLALFTFFSSPPPRHHPVPVCLSPALHLLLSPCVLPVAHDTAVQPQADCGAHTAGEAALGGALAQRTGASSSSRSSLFSLLCADVFPCD